jgi:hypothetical protein
MGRGLMRADSLRDARLKGNLDPMRWVAPWDRDSRVVQVRSRAIHNHRKCIGVQPSNPTTNRRAQGFAAVRNEYYLIQA